MKTSYLFLCVAERPVVNLHSQLYLTRSPLHASENEENAPILQIH